MPKFRPGSKTHWLINTILSLAVMVLGFILWLIPRSFNFPENQSWIGLILLVYGFLRAFMSYQHWRRLK